jgi:hypothetical protein
MKTTKKAARIGADQLIAGIAAASTGAKARIEQLGHKDVDGVAGGIDGGGVIGDIVKDVIDIVGGTTQGMFPTDDGPVNF